MSAQRPSMTGGHAGAARVGAWSALGLAAVALLVWALEARRPVWWTMGAALVAASVIALRIFRLARRSKRERAIYFDADLPESFFSGESERAREIAASTVREPRLVTIEMLRERAAEFPELMAFLDEHMKTVPPRAPESLEGAVGPDIYHIRQGLRVES
jgi:hypothetical protein